MTSGYTKPLYLLPFDYRTSFESGMFGWSVLVRGENEQQVGAWLATAATVPGFIGFALGRTTFWDPLVAYRDRKITREAAVAEIGRRYCQWVDTFEQARTVAGHADMTPTALRQLAALPQQDRSSQ